jgi:hypothetical protein
LSEEQVSLISVLLLSTEEPWPLAVEVPADVQRLLQGKEPTSKYARQYARDSRSSLYCALWPLRTRLEENSKVPEIQPTSSLKLVMVVPSLFEAWPLPAVLSAVDATLPAGDSEKGLVDNEDLLLLVPV